MRPRISRARRSDGRGFTLVEVVAALAILTVLVSTAAMVHVQSLKAGRQADALGASLAPLERVSAERLAGLDPRIVAEEARREGWMVAMDVTGGGGETLWESWRISPTGQPWAAVSVCLTPVLPGAARP